VVTAVEFQLLSNKPMAIEGQTLLVDREALKITAMVIERLPRGERLLESATEVTSKTERKDCFDASSGQFSEMLQDRIIPFVSVLDRVGVGVYSEIQALWAMYIIIRLSLLYI
jgi:hypothetical protein